MTVNNSNYSWDRMKTTHVVDFEKLIRLLDEKRVQEHLLWADVADQAGVSRPTMSTLVRSYSVGGANYRRSTSSDVMVSLVMWLGGTKAFALVVTTR